MAPVTPPSMPMMPSPSTYEVGGPSTLAAEGQSFTLPAPGFPVPSPVNEDWHPYGEIGLRVSVIEGHAQVGVPDGSSCRLQLSTLLRRLEIVLVILIFGFDQGLGAVNGLDGTNAGSGPPFVSVGSYPPGRGLKRNIGYIDLATRMGRKNKIEQEFERGETLGQWKFGYVVFFNGKLVSKVNGDQYACKSLPKGEEIVHKEVEIMQHLFGHQGIVTLKAMYEDAQYIHLVMKLCSGWHLFDQMRKDGWMLEYLNREEHLHERKGVVCFGKRGKLNPRYIRPFKVLAKVGTIAYTLKLPKQLSIVYNTFYVSNLKKCLSDEPLAISLDEVRIDDKLRFVKEPVEVMDRELKRLKQSRIPIIIFRWNSRRGPEFTWEREDRF
nr:putative reverse transcriptase domain-containing protein [Tanacetum cinerariifolium]